MTCDPAPRSWSDSWVWIASNDEAGIVKERVHVDGGSAQPKWRHQVLLNPSEEDGGKPLKPLQAGTGGRGDGGGG